MPVIKKNETLADYVTREIGNVSGLFYLAQKNGIGITDDVTAGTDLNFVQTEVDLLLSTVKNKSVSVPEYVPQAPAKILKKHQNNFDFVTQHAGSMDYIFQMAILNGISITKKPQPGEALQVEISDEKTADYFSASGYVIASGPDDNSMRLPGGIGYMKIESTFIVS